jgi:hypothetical protein
MKKIGILAYGSLIEDPGVEIAPHIASRVTNVQTPFNIEFARTSTTRDGAPTLVIVENGGALVKATILVLKDTVSIAQAMDMVWRRETRKENTDLSYKKVATPGKNHVIVETLEGFYGIDTVLYTKLGANIDNPTPERLAELAIRSAKAESGKKGTDGINYLVSVKRQGISTPLIQMYEESILKILNFDSLEDALLKIRDKNMEKFLWDELKLIQPIIDKFDDIAFKIKNWFITIFLAVVGISIVLKHQNPSSLPADSSLPVDRPSLLVLNIFLIFIFYFYEVTYRTAHKSFLSRSREIQKILRRDQCFKEEDKSPNIDRYIFPDNANIDSSRFLKQLLNLYKKWRITEDRAKRFIFGNKAIVEEAFIMFIQFRVSFIYIAAFAINIIMAVILKDSLALYFSALFMLLCIALGVYRIRNTKIENVV